MSLATKCLSGSEEAKRAGTRLMWGMEILSDLETREQGVEIKESDKRMAGRERVKDKRILEKKRVKRQRKAKIR